MKRCGFCEELKLHREMKKRDHDERFRDQYYVKLHIVTERWFRDGTWEECGASTHRRHPLKYCPQCGKKIVE